MKVYNIIIECSDFNTYVKSFKEKQDALKEIQQLYEEDLRESEDKWNDEYKYDRDMIYDSDNKLISFRIFESGYYARDFFSVQLSENELL